MSIIHELGEKYTNLPKVLADYETAIGDVESLLNLKGKRLEAANIENPSWQYYYDQRRVELNTLLKYFDSEVQRVRSKLFKSYKEQYSRELSEREIAKYIDGEEAFLVVNQLYLEVKELHDKFQSIVDAFQARAFALNNITKIRVAAIEHTEL